MTDKNVVIAAAELERLHERIRKLSAQKSYLLLINTLMSRLNATPGLEGTIRQLLEGVLDVLGGTNIIVYYVVDGDIISTDVFGTTRHHTIIEDPFVQHVFDRGEFLETEQDYDETLMQDSVFDNAVTWVIPLKVYSQTIGVLKMENMHLGSQEMRDHLPAFFSYAALMLSNEINNHTRLKDTCHQLSEENRLRHLAEEDLRTLNRELEGRVADRTKELEERNRQLAQEIAERKQAQDELSRKNIEVERFLYAVSHDLRSPLVTVKTFLGYLKQDMSSVKSERVIEDFEYIDAAANRMVVLLDELLKISRIGRISNAPETVNFRDLVTEALGAVAGQIAIKNVTIQREDIDQPLSGDRSRLLQLWQNLLENAVKYSGDQANPSIKIGMHTDKVETVFYVRDNGIGIAPENHDRVFGIFEQLDRNSGGFGMGLAMVRRIVELYGGRIWVESEGNRLGSCFNFTLPKAVPQNTGS